MNHEPFDDELASTLRMLVEDAEPSPMLRARVDRRMTRAGLPRGVIVLGSVAAAVMVIAALLVGHNGGGNRQRLAAGPRGTTTIAPGVLVPAAGQEQSPGTTVPGAPTTTVPRRTTTSVAVTITSRCVVAI